MSVQPSLSGPESFLDSNPHLVGLCPMVVTLQASDQIAKTATGLTTQQVAFFRALARALLRPLAHEFPSLRISRHFLRLSEPHFNTFPQMTNISADEDTATAGIKSLDASNLDIYHDGAAQAREKKTNLARAGNKKGEVTERQPSSGGCPDTDEVCVKLKREGAMCFCGAGGGGDAGGVEFAGGRRCGAFSAVILFSQPNP